MKQELEDKLFKDYPDIFKQKDLPMSQTCMCWGIDTGDGWYTIIDSLCAAIADHIKYNNKEISVEATQVKEKFGGLRFYYEGGDDYIEGLIDMASALSYKTCEKCANPATSSSDGGYWIRTLCKACRYDCAA